MYLCMYLKLYVYEKPTIFYLTMETKKMCSKLKLYKLTYYIS